MKAFYRDPNTGWQESVRDGPWDELYTPLLTNSCLIAVPLFPVFVDGEIWWEIHFRETAGSAAKRRVYRWDWEGDASLMLREAIYAAQLSAAAS